MSNSMNQAADLALRLSSLSQFLPATEDLVVGLDMSLPSIRRHSRKIVRLIEIARNTLRNHSIRLHEFASCPPAIAPFKNAYFNLLKWMRCICVFFDPALKPRVTRLLLPLSSDMVIYRRGSPVSSEDGDSSEGSPRLSPWSPTMRRSLSRSPSPSPRPQAANAMLPPVPPTIFDPETWIVPSNYPPANAQSFVRYYREPSSPLWDSEEVVQSFSVPLPKARRSSRKNGSSRKRRASEPFIPPIAIPCLPLMPMSFQGLNASSRKEDRSFGSY